MQINFISSKDSGETRTMHTKSRNIEIMVGSETNDIIEELSESPLQNYQKGLEESIRGNELIYLCWSIVLPSSKKQVWTERDRHI